METESPAIKGWRGFKFLFGQQAQPQEPTQDTDIADQLEHHLQEIAFGGYRHQPGRNRVAFPFSTSTPAACQSERISPMAALKMLKPRLSTLDTRRVKTLVPAFNPIATPRQRGRAWMQRRARWLRANPLCVMCEQHGRITAACEVDHIVELQDGGADDESNYQSLCSECHQAKTDSERRRRAKG